MGWDLDGRIGSVIIDGAPRHIADDVEREWAWFELRPDAPFLTNLSSAIINPTTDRSGFNQEFIAWMLEEPNPEAVAFFDAMSTKTPDGIASLINAMAIPVDFSDELALLSRTQATLIVVREEWREIAGTWVRANAPEARLETMAKHATFWERPGPFNDLLAGWLAESLGWSA